MISTIFSFQLSSNCHSIQNFSPIDGLSHSLALSRLGIICTIKDSPQLHFFVQKGTNLFQLDGNGSHNLPKWPWICHLNCSANSFWGFIGSSFWAVICCHIGRHKATTSFPHEADASRKLIDDDVLHILCYQSRKTEMASGNSSLASASPQLIGMFSSLQLGGR